MKKFLTVLSLMAALITVAQDNIKVMQYNLLNFGNFTDYCTLSNNDPNNKIGWLKTIIDYNVPDILSVNEIGTSSFYHDLVLSEALNTDGRNYFERAVATNFAGSDIINMLYYNSNKLGLAAQDVITTTIRDINVYKLYYKQPNLASSNDTIFLYLMVAHLKSGDATSDRATRAQMTLNVMSYIASHNITDACMMMGDFNLQNNTELAWINLTAWIPEVYRFSDPTGMDGAWHNNAAFSALHTQSTHTVSNGCAAAGGMDDRFDFILTNSALSNPENPIHYISGSYFIQGQDGLRINGSLIDPPNNSAPEDVINALYGLSDHLPVTVDLYVEVETEVLPASWNFNTTMSSHIITIPFSANPTLNQATLPPGSYIGVFYLDNETEKCAGNILWEGTGNTAIVAYGDDWLTSVKDGFSEGEQMIFKVLTTADAAEYYAGARFDDNWPDHDGAFYSGGISSVTKLDAFYLQSHTVIVKSGWSGISSFLTPKWKSLEQIFGASLENVTYLTDGNLIYYPAGGMDNLNIWDNQTALIIKANQQITIELEGIPTTALTFQLTEGWNLIPVPVPCYVDPDEINLALSGNLEAIKSVAGLNVYWPEMNINTLPLLIPGNSYFIKVSNDCIFTFGACE